MANLFGHEAGNGGHRQGKPATPPRRPPTRPRESARSAANPTEAYYFERALFGGRGFKDAIAPAASALTGSAGSRAISFRLVTAALRTASEAAFEQIPEPVGHVSSGDLILHGPEPPEPVQTVGVCKIFAEELGYY